MRNCPGMSFVREKSNDLGGSRVWPMMILCDLSGEVEVSTSLHVVNVVGCMTAREPFLKLDRISDSDLSDSGLLIQYKKGTPRVLR